MAVSTQKKNKLLSQYFHFPQTGIKIVLKKNVVNIYTFFYKNQ